MTTNKSLKRDVRSRMAKTGERYTAARRQVLAKTLPSDPTHGATPEPTPELTPVAPSLSAVETLHGPTDRPLSEWFALLDAAGAREMPHPDIVKWLTAEHSVAPWWRQDITVRYEKHIGRRVLGQRGSTFSATGTKVIAVSAAVARAAWVDETQRARWLPDVTLRQRPNKVLIAARFDVNDSDGRIMVSFDPRGDAKTQIAIEHEKLPDTDAAKRWTTFWRSRLTELKQVLENG